MHEGDGHTRVPVEALARERDIEAFLEVDDVLQVSLGIDLDSKIL